MRLGVSTLEPNCYFNYVPQQEVVDYFLRTAKLFKRLDTYKALSAYGIEPSNVRTWTLKEIETALKSFHGAGVTLRCRGTALDEVWYHFDVKGSLQTGIFVPAEPDSMKSACPTAGIRYFPKRILPTHSTSTTTVTETAVPTTTSAPFAGSGYLEVFVNPEKHGCLISHGDWYTSGTCATYHAETDVVSPIPQEHSFTLTSSKGPCSFIHGVFRCGADNSTQAIFSEVNGSLSFQQSSTFWAEEIPPAAAKGKVWREKKNHNLELDIRWAAR